MEQHLNLTKREKILLAAAGVSFVLFAITLYFVSAEDVLAFDTGIRESIYSMRNSMLTPVLVFITYIGNWQTVTALSVLLLICSGTRKNIGIPFTIATVTSTTIYEFLKSAVGRPRPDISLHLINQGGYSFPSGHSMNCIVCYGMLIYLIRRYVKNTKLKNGMTVLIGLLIIMIGFSRIYVGVHFPTDIIGGWSLGLTILCISIIILEKRRGVKDDFQ